MTWFFLLCFFVLAALGDYLSVYWHKFREQKRVVPATVLSILLETLNWVPVWFAIEWGDVRILVASVLGAAVGTAVAMR